MKQRRTNVNDIASTLAKGGRGERGYIRLASAVLNQLNQKIHNF